MPGTRRHLGEQMLDNLRAAWGRLITPLAKALLKIGIKPDHVTWLGTIATVVISFMCFPVGWLWQGVLLLLLFALSDSLDGTMARLSKSVSGWGEFLDATLDRIADGAIIGGLMLYLAHAYESLLPAAIALGALIMAQVTSYARARGEAVGVKVTAGLITRADRIVLCLLGALLTGLGVDVALVVVMIVLVIGGMITVIQRMYLVHRALHEKTDTDS